MAKLLRLLPLVFLCLAVTSEACTAFKTTRDGRTLVGCNEDAWSINAQVRFEPAIVAPGSTRGRAYGVVYFAHYNGHPLRAMTDQLGMNEAGLVFDGLSLAPGAVKRREGMPWMETFEAVVSVMRTCSTVQQVEAFLRTVDTGPLNGMLFFCDAEGGYLVLEPDTMFTGNDPWYAVGNWRMSTCGDPASIPIPRLQEGRQVLAAGAGNDLDVAAEALERMAVCRERMGEGTLFSTLFDTESRFVHLTFYHDFTQEVVFDLDQELAKGPHTVALASLFGPRPEYERLKSHLTPFHQRWLWWGLAGLGLLALLFVLWSVALFFFWVFAVIRTRSFRNELPWFAVGTGSALTIFLVAMLLMVEGVYYFGLGEAVDRVHPLLRWAPMALLVFALWSLLRSRRGARLRMPLRVLALTQFVLLGWLVYWGMLWP